MATSSPNNRVELTLKITGVVLALAAVFIWFLPTPPPPAIQIVVGDPISACAYPAEQFGPAKVDELAQMDGTRPVVFDEFNDWRNARYAGYGACN